MWHEKGSQAGLEHRYFWHTHTHTRTHTHSDKWRWQRYTSVDCKVSLIKARTSCSSMRDGWQQHSRLLCVSGLFGPDAPESERADWESRAVLGPLLGESECPLLCLPPWWPWCPLLWLLVWESCLPKVTLISGSLVAAQNQVCQCVHEKSNSRLQTTVCLCYMLSVILTCQTTDHRSWSNQ